MPPATVAVLLIRAAQRWRAEHDSLPKTVAQRNDFKGLLKAWQRHFDGVPLDVSVARRGHLFLECSLDMSDGLPQARQRGA